jgi:hypothetical protein
MYLYKSMISFIYKKIRFYLSKYKFLEKKKKKLNF